MTSNTDLDYGRMRDDELEQLGALIGQALFFPAEDMRSWILQLGARHFRVVRRNGRPIAGLGLIPMGHWFGGASVRTAGVTAVGVAPEHRGSGVGLFMMRRALEELQAAGTPLSSLYRATDAFYRRAGYERASTRTIYEISPAAIGIRDYALDVVPIGLEHEPELRRLYADRGRVSSGQIDRHEFTWVMLHHHEKRNPYRYLVTRGGRAEGYVAFAQAGRDDPIVVTDICAGTPEAGRRLWTLLADHRTMVEKIRWSGAPNDGLAFLLPEQSYTVHRRLNLMLRIVDVAKALAARGYPADRIRERVDWALAAVGIAALRNDAPHRLSGGQRQRLAVAGVLALRPQVLVADEITAMLDPLSRAALVALLHDLHRTYGLTIIHVTHLLEEIVQADRVVALDAGQVALAGPPATIFADLARLQQLRLNIPEPIALAARLRAAGVAISPAALTVEAIADELARLRRKR